MVFRHLLKENHVKFIFQKKTNHQNISWAVFSGQFGKSDQVVPEAVQGK